MWLANMKIYSATAEINETNYEIFTKDYKDYVSATDVKHTFIQCR